MLYTLFSGAGSSRTTSSRFSVWRFYRVSFCPKLRPSLQPEPQSPKHLTSQTTRNQEAHLKHSCLSRNILVVKMIELNWFCFVLFCLWTFYINSTLTDGINIYLKGTILTNHSLSNIKTLTYRILRSPDRT